MRGISIVCVLCMLVACDEGVTGPTTPIGADFVLQPGATAVVEGANTRVRFDRVTNDSRCPADAVCIQGGDALVHITVTGEGATREYDLHTGDMRPVRHESLTIHLVQLVPYPFSARTIQPDEYRATLRVTR